MFGIVVAAHGELGTALVRSAEAVSGPLERVRAVSIDRSAAPEATQRALAAAIEAVGGDGEGVLVLCDLFGGTAANASLSGDLEGPLEVVTGANLPMLLKACTVRDRPLDEAAELLVPYGRRHIAHASRMVREHDVAGHR